MTCFLELFEHLRVAEEVSDCNKKIVGQRANLFGPFPKPFEIRLEIFEMVELHPPRDAPENRGTLVAAEIAVGPRPQLREYPLQNHPLARRNFIAIGRHGQARLRVVEAENTRGDFRYGQNEIRQSGRDGALRHPVVFRLIRILYNDEPAVCLDIFHAERAVRSGTG